MSLIGHILVEKKHISAFFSCNKTVPFQSKKYFYCSNFKIVTVIFFTHDKQPGASMLACTKIVWHEWFLQALGPYASIY